VEIWEKMEETMVQTQGSLHCFLPNDLFPLDFLTEICVIFHTSHAWCTAWQDHSVSVDHTNIWWRVKIMNLFNMQYFPTSCYTALFGWNVLCSIFSKTPSICILSSIWKTTVHTRNTLIFPFL
jgi:hypothetical protein